MNRWTGMLMGLSLVMLAGSPLLAQEEKAEAKKAEAKAKQADSEAQKAKKNAEQKKAAPKGKKASLADTKLKELVKAALTEEQIEQIKTLAAEFEPKLQEARKKVNELIPAETRKARQEALAKAKAEGKKPEEVVTAFKLTEEQIAAQKAVQRSPDGLQQKVNRTAHEGTTPGASQSPPGRAGGKETRTQKRRRSEES